MRAPPTCSSRWARREAGDDGACRIGGNVWRSGHRRECSGSVAGPLLNAASARDATEYHPADEIGDAEAEVGERRAG